MLSHKYINAFKETRYYHKENIHNNKDLTKVFHQHAALFHVLDVTLTNGYCRHYLPPPVINELLRLMNNIYDPLVQLFFFESKESAINFYRKQPDFDFLEHVHVMC